ncbi:S-formylglutathione hydrolase FrmB [Dysgonomonas sp. PFB1-18]|uniref:alpha/beta hydrolase n=1 Tax=unclassified Dysgonomonas TaxID=2630389 RepID=UPI00247349F2|nr:MULTISPECIES: alpha/beta hydrolase family protein [unclassified Dysgonomonas]MDH6307335.1 S-formylglutathione hydrolase FrmB [Dysgonomonas sp. PF1-14]MDH6337253.1 S-formylglutathione hydrolase FrmB [Dysgonomonas sp. PF1-16]MDH6379177.1 S-formylglutathione hydrolase FrmB [Dysgonomonas sp. PFB1-18]MDH6396185.1 S-formylglutathione hydrolase FrmB [Dysgonomonas sp. PF1-23]
MKKYLSLLLLVALSLSGLQAQRVDTVTVLSKKMNRNIKNVVVLPEGYDKASDKKYPVVYLLHGYGGKYDTWVKGTKKSLPQDATRLQMIFVCPDGQNSWYWDSPVEPSMQFETYVSSELISYIDSHYNTVASPKGRAVTGFSMGGHGGLWLGINNPDVFGACGSMSGGVDIRPFPNNWEMKKWLGSYKQNTKVWDDHTVITQLDKIEPNTLAIIIDCGKDDFFFQVNEQLHKEMLYRNIPHDYIIRPGGHTHDYWNNAVDYQMLFFSKFFNQK